MQPSGVLGVLPMMISSFGRSEWVDHVLIESDGKVVARRWDTVITAPRRPNGLVVGPSGRMLLGRVAFPVDDANAGPAIEQLVVFDVATRQMVQTGITQHTDKQKINYALAGDDQTLAVAISEGGQGQRHLTLTVMGVRGLQNPVSRSFPDTVMRSSSGFDHLLQWSPPADHLTMQVREPGELYDSLLILDAATLETTYRLEDTWLMGSASWSAEGDKLAVVDYHEPRILHLAEQRLETLPWLRATRHDPPRGPEILGLLTDGKALVEPLSRTRARFVIADLATGKGPTVASIPIDHRDWPARPMVSRGWEHLANSPQK